MLSLYYGHLPSSRDGVDCSRVTGTLADANARLMNVNADGTVHVVTSSGLAASKTVCVQCVDGLLTETRMWDDLWTVRHFSCSPPGRFAPLYDSPSRRCGTASLYKSQTPLHGHRLRTPPTDKLTTILQQICHIAMPKHNISTCHCQDVGIWQIFVRWWCSLVVFVVGVRSRCPCIVEFGSITTRVSQTWHQT